MLYSKSLVTAKPVPTIPTKRPTDARSTVLHVIFSSSFIAIVAGRMKAMLAPLAQPTMSRTEPRSGEASATPSVTKKRQRVVTVHCLSVSSRLRFC